jgi:hypothetical protein
MTTQTADLGTTHRPRGHRASLLTLTAGAVFTVVPLLVEFVAGEAFALMGVALLLLLVALPALRRLQDGRDGRAGLWGLRATVAGLVGMAVLVLSGDLLDAALSGTAQAVAEGAWLVVGLLSVLAALGGVIAFSIGLTRARILSAVGIWVFLAGMTVGLVSETFEQSLSGAVPWLADVVPVVSFVAAGVGLLLLGRSARAVEG